MRIPQYDNKVNAPNAPQFNNTADLRNDSLSSVADGLEQVYKVKLKEDEEAKKTAFLQADTSIKMAMDQAMFDIKSKLQNGGSYADAEAQYQKAHDTAIKQFGSAFDADKSGNVRLRSMAEYQSAGLDNILKIRDAVSTRRRSDARSSINLRAEQLAEQYIGKTEEEKSAIRNQLVGSLAGGAAVGLYTGAEGKQKAKEQIQKMDAMDLKLTMQNDALAGKSSLAEIESRYKEGRIDADTYISYRGMAIKQDKVNVVDMSVEETKKFVDTAKRAARGELTPEDYADKENPIIKAEMENYAPYDPSEIGNVRIDLNSKLDALEGMTVKKSTTGDYKVPDWAKTNEGVTKAVSQIRQFQDEVIEAKARGAFTGNSKNTYLTMIKKTNQILGDMKLAIEEPETTWSERLKFGVQQPEIYVADIANNMTKDIPLQGIRDWETKTEFRDSVMEKLGDWKSSGDRDKDEAAINAVAKTVARQMVEDGFPHLRGSALLKEADRMVGDGVDIKITPDRKVKIKDIDSELKSIDEELNSLGGN